MKNIIHYIFIYCYILLFNNINALDIDANWMSFISDDTLRLNQINIPGTHDSGAYDTKWTNAPWSEAQSLTIKEQLEYGIRYFDLRLTIDEDDAANLIHITHNGMTCYDDSDILYLSEVLEDCINFLIHHPLEAIIVQVKSEKLPNKITSVPKKFENILALNTILNSTVIKDEKNNEILFKDFFYSNDTMPRLKDAQGKIVLLTRYNLYYNFTENNNVGKIGKTIYIPEMGDCYEYRSTTSDSSRDTDGDKCLPVIYGNSVFRVQDDYNLEKDDKWDMVYDVLTNNVKSRNDTANYIILPDSETNRFNDTNHKNVLTLNFMNIGRASREKGYFSLIMDTLFDSSIEKSASYMNERLVKYDGTIYNQWIMLDFPSPDVVRKIYQTNNISIPNAFSLKNITRFIDTIYYFVNSKFSSSVKRSENNENPEACLQRKIVIDEHGKQDLIKTNYKCIKNKLNQWSIDKNDKYFNIISKYDGKCLNYDNDKLSMDECNKNNKYEDFTIKDGQICSRINGSKCIDGNYDFIPKILESKIYDNLTCSTRFAKRGFSCCSNQNTQVEYVDEIGNWGIENGKLCGIGYERCSFSILGYPCCSSVNPAVAYTDNNGSWGFEDGEWCGIGEMVTNSKFRIRNKKTQECLITNLHSDTDVLLMGDCNHSEWTYQNDQLVLDATGKCLYAMNSQNGRMIECSKADDQINHHIHFKIVDNKFICIKNNVDPNDHCLNGNTLNFETSKNDYSEWIIENLDNGKIINSIKGFIESNPNMGISEFKYAPITTTSLISTTIATPSTPTIKPPVTPKPGYNVYWFYHAFTNKCLYAPENINGGKIMVKPCDDSNYSKWMVLSSRKGYFYSMAYPDYCLRVENINEGSLSLGKCDEQANLEHNNDGYFISLLSNDKCIGILNSNDLYNNEIELNLNKCVKNNEEQFFVWDHNPTSTTTTTISTDCYFEALGYPCCSPENTAVIYVDENGKWGAENDEWCGIIEPTSNPTLSPNTEIYYLYNANMNKCIYTSGILGTPITFNDCDYSNNTLWSIPYTHNGKFRSKVNSNYCIMLSDATKGTLILGECEKDGTTFYREGNSILSSSSKNKCIGVSNSDASVLVMNDCNNKLDDQVFYFNLWNV